MTSPTIFVSTKPALLNFPRLFDAVPFMDKGKPKGDPVFSTGVIFAPGHPDIALFKTAAVAAAKAKWPGRDIAADYKAGKITMPWTLGNAEIDKINAKRTEQKKESAKPEEVAHLKDAVLLKSKAKAERPPRLALAEGGKYTENVQAQVGPVRAAAATKFYSGVEAAVELNFLASTVNGNDYVTAYINQVTSSNTGKRLGNFKTAEETFADVFGKATTENPLQDEIPF